MNIKNINIIFLGSMTQYKKCDITPILSNRSNTIVSTGTITTIIGPMFSGKTTELIRMIERKRFAEKKCVIIKHAIDNRFDHILNDLDDNSSHVTTHSQYVYQKCHIIYLSSLDNYTEHYRLISNYDVIGIEEGFFFSGIADFCNKLAFDGKDVIVSTLDTNYQQKIFPEIAELIGLSETVIKLTAVCMICKKMEGSFTIRTIESEQEILVGGSDMYQSVCRTCLKNFKNSQK